MGRRARLTVTTVVYSVVGIAALAALYPPFLDLLGALEPRLDEGTALLLKGLLPVMCVVLLAVLYAEARAGGGGTR